MACEEAASAGGLIPFLEARLGEAMARVAVMEAALGVAGGDAGWRPLTCGCGADDDEIGDTPMVGMSPSDAPVMAGGGFVPAARPGSRRRP